MLRWAAGAGGWRASASGATGTAGVPACVGRRWATVRGVQLLGTSQPPDAAAAAAARARQPFSTTTAALVSRIIRMGKTRMPAVEGAEPSLVPAGYVGTSTLPVAESAAIRAHLEWMMKKEILGQVS